MCRMTPDPETFSIIEIRDASGKTIWSEECGCECHEAGRTNLHDCCEICPNCGKPIKPFLNGRHKIKICPKK